jgi:HAMP domain-containing protein
MDTTILRTYSLIAGAAMILIVALPLILIIQAARRINYHVNEIREAGKKIAGYTVSIRMPQTILGRSAGRSISRRLTVARISQ